MSQNYEIHASHEYIPSQFVCDQVLMGVLIYHCRVDPAEDQDSDRDESESYDLTQLCDS